MLCGETNHETPARIVAEHFTAESLQKAVQSVILSVAHIPKSQRASVLRSVADAIEAGGAE